MIVGKIPINLQSVKGLVRLLLRWIYKVNVTGINNYHNAGERVLIIANHTSLIDVLLLAAFLPDKVTFALNARTFDKSFLRALLSLVDTFALEPTDPLSAKALIRLLQEGRKVVLFPEGRVTVTGSLMKIYDHVGMIADHAGAAILPIRIDGAQLTPFSKLKYGAAKRWFPAIKLFILPPERLEIPAALKGRARRAYPSRHLADTMTKMMFQTSHYESTLFDALIDAQAIYGPKHIVVEDVQWRPLTYRQVITRSLAIGKALAAITDHKEYVGVLLPNVATTVVVFMGLQAHGRVPAMLNYTAGGNGMAAACRTAQLKKVVTSRKFIETAELQSEVEILARQSQVIYLEDVGEGISRGDKLRALLGSYVPRRTYRRHNGGVSPSDPAVVLFTSGSEGTPKGVVLSHANLLANRAQLTSRVDFNADDVILNAMPLFHSFGLTGGTLLPLLSGMKAFFYPSPLHYRVVPEVAYEVNATILFGTNTFLAGYAKNAHPYDFYSIRYVFAGAEKLQDETRRLWVDRFGVRIFEGYGATETSPVLAFNTPMENQPGSVGRFLPDISSHLESVPGVAEGGKLHVKGPNVMLGYLMHDKPGQIVPPRSDQGEGWYDTGDIVTIDEDGFVTLVGRLKRFAKIGGEMVSLTAVEELIYRAWPEQRHAVVAIADSQRGEQLILVTEHSQPERSVLLQQARKDLVNEINVPKKILSVPALPLMGTGKTDYPGIAALVQKELGA